jgi:hypothetical protein
MDDMAMADLEDMVDMEASVDMEAMVRDTEVMVVMAGMDITVTLKKPM